MNFVKTLECVSPIDGSVYASRQSLSLDEALIKLDLAKQAQLAWQQLPLAERVAIVMKG
ncbi:MAG: acyl-CoA reductase-like NAD-dependent aldehyde dehydrogenase, partial [Pseudomonadales bacterium]